MCDHPRAEPLPSARPILGAGKSMEGNPIKPLRFIRFA
jgi:hypothetical protein